MVEKNKNKLCVIIHTSNCENTICETLESVKNADEIVLIDENSKDDTIEIAKEYKAKIIYSNPFEIDIAFKQILDEIQSDWFFIVAPSEIVPERLFFKLQDYINAPKKNINLLSVPIKNFYYKDEIKFLRKKTALRLFKKNYATLKNNYSLELTKKQGKIFKLNKNFKLENVYLYNFLEKDVSKEIEKCLMINKYESKKFNNIKSSCFLKPLAVFFYWFIFKRAFFNKHGYIISMKFACLEFIKQFILQERLRSFKNDI